MLRERITITIKHDVVDKLDALIDGQKIRNRSNAIETIVLDYFKKGALKKAVLLSGSRGIKVNGKVIAKVLLPLKGKTLLEKNIETLKNFGITEIAIAASEWTADIKKLFGDGKKLGVAIKYYDKKKDGTASVLSYMQKNSNETFFMANGDILLDNVDISDMYDFHKKNKGLATMGIVVISDPTDLGSVAMKGDKIISFKEKPSALKYKSHLINGGVYILEQEACELVENYFSMMEQDVFPRLAEEGQLFGYQLGKEWIHLHDEKAYQKYSSNN
ncbi:MAG: sugar phosphate nucleotidyltransferase [Candidatus Moraniibacteriota bacterium]